MPSTQDKEPETTIQFVILFHRSQATLNRNGIQEICSPLPCSGLKIALSGILRCTLGALEVSTAERSEGSGTPLVLLMICVLCCLVMVIATYAALKYPQSCRPLPLHVEYVRVRLYG